MRSLVGLIVGVGLGALLMYFSWTAFTVGGMALSQPPRRQTSDGPLTLSTPDTADTTRRQRELAELGRTMATHLMDTCKLSGTAIVLESSRRLQDAVAITEAFRTTLDTSPTIEVLQAKRVHGLLDGSLAAAALFCADHDDLRDLAVAAATRGRALPPLYTAGLSPWLVQACAQSPCPIAGVALTISGRAIREANPVLGEAGTPSSEPNGVASTVVVFSPADLVALSGGTTAPPATVSKPVDAKTLPGDTP